LDLSFFIFYLYPLFFKQINTPNHASPGYWWAKFIDERRQIENLINRAG
jgi:hypothetical protein